MSAPLDPRAACELTCDAVPPELCGRDEPWITFGELPWPVPQAVRDYLHFQAFVEPSCPQAFALFMRYSVLAAFEYVYELETDEDEHEPLWQEFVAFAEGDWSPARVAAWLRSGLESLAGEPLEEHWRRLYYLRIES